MSLKRGATSELNHDNWDDEEAKEDPGSFQKATNDEIKTRVIRKAKRRGIGPSNSGAEGESPGASSLFSSFKGFGGAAATSAAPQFGGFAAATTGISSAPKAAGLFDFIKKPETDDANNGSPAGTPAVSSPQSPESPTITFKQFGASNTSAGFSFGAPATSVTTTSTTSETGSSGLFSFMSKPSPGSEAAKTAPSPTDLKTPVAGDDETPKKAPAAPAASGGFADFLKKQKQSGNWSCDTCMASNPGDKDVCPCCETPKPGAAPQKAAAAPAPIGAVGAGGFTFGSGASTSTSKPNAGGFNFGTSTAKSTSATTPGSGFTFGNGSSTTTAAPSGGFTFGSSSGSGASSGGSGTASLTNQPDLKTSTSGSPTKSFGFGAPKEATAAKNGLKDSEKSTPDQPPSDEYFFHLKALNEQCYAWIKQHVDRDPYVLLTAVFEDYASHIKDIEKKYKVPAQSSKSLNETSKEKEGKKPEEEPKHTKTTDQAPAPAPSFSFGSGSTASSSFSSGTTSEAEKPKEASKPSSSSSGTFTFGSSKASEVKSGFTFGTDSANKPAAPAQSGFTFGTDSANKPAAPAQSGFTFGTDTSKPDAPSTGFSFGSAPSGGFSFSNVKPPAPTTETQSGNQEEESDEPPKVEVKSVEEEDSIYSVRCKLFYMLNKEFKDKGVGALHLKPTGGANDKTQVVVRAETNLGNILLNIMLNEKMSFVQRKNNVQFVCVPNPPIKGIEGPCSMLIRVKTEDLAKELVAKVEERQKK